MENYNQNTIEKLNHLIAIAEDGKEGYENAAEEVKDISIKSSFLLFSKDRANYGTQLRQLVHQLNGESEEKGGGSLGLLHRVWMDLKSIFTTGDTEAIVNACITGEEAAIKNYQEYLDDVLIAENYKIQVREQLRGIQQTLAGIKALVQA